MNDINKIIDDICGTPEVKLAKEKPSDLDLRKIASTLDGVASKMVEKEPCSLAKYANEYIPNNLSEEDMYKEAFAKLFKRVKEKGVDLFKKKFTRSGRAEAKAEKFQRDSMESSGAADKLRMKGETPENMSRKELAKSISNKKYKKGLSRVKNIARKHPGAIAAGSIVGADALNVDVINRKNKKSGTQVHIN
jgi:hypothetical protein